MSSPGGIVYVVDDHAAMRKALTRLLRAEGLGVRAFASAREFLAAYDMEEAACLLLDVEMPELNGLELQGRLAHAGVSAPIVFLTGHGDIPMSVRAIKAGAVDFLTKPVNDTALLRAVRAALQVAASQKSARATLAGLTERFGKLTPREREVMIQVVAGKLNKQIAADLGAAEQTIKIHRGRVMEKMEVESLADLVRAAEQLNIGRSSDLLLV
jgi:two-component system, LuxR family, response regulator FixJ